MSSKCPTLGHSPSDKYLQPTILYTAEMSSDPSSIVDFPEITLTRFALRIFHGGRGDRGRSRAARLYIYIYI